MGVRVDIPLGLIDITQKAIEEHMHQKPLKCALHTPTGSTWLCRAHSLFIIYLGGGGP